jgi:PAS domain S-box-containing protein
MSDKPVVVSVGPDSLGGGRERALGTVRGVSSVAAALETLAATTPDCVVVDHAPEDGVDGLAVLDDIRDAYPTVPVVLCTDRPDGTVAAQATQLGVTEYVPRSEVDLDARVAAVASDSADQQSRERELERNNEALQRLTQLDTSGTLSNEEILERVLELGADRLGLSLGYLSRIDDSDYEIVSVVGDHDVIQAGTSTDLENTYCRRTVNGEASPGIRDATAEGWADDTAYQLSGLACYLGGTVVVDGELYGTLCFADEEPRSEPFSESEQTFTRLLAEWTSRELERRQREADLERYENVIEAVDDGIYALDETGHFQLVNDAMTDLTGYEESALLGAHTSTIKSDAVVERAASIVRSMIFDEREGNEATFDLEILRADGAAIPAEDHMTLLWDEGGETFEGTAGIIRDITAQKERDQRLSRLLETTRSLMQAHTAEAVAETVVDAAESGLGFDLNLVRLHDEETATLAPAAATAGMPDRPLYDADEGFPGEAFQRGETIRVDDFGEVTNYDSRNANAAMYVPLDDHGVLSVATTGQDAFDDADVAVAEILASNAAAALDRVERERDLLRYETVVENVRDMVYVLDEDGRFQLVTEPLAEWLGYERTELQGSHPRAVLDEASVAAFDKRIRDIRETDGDGTIQMETTLFTAHGEERPVEIEVSLIDETGFRGTAGVVRDRTELEQTREELRDERDRFSYLFNNLPDAVVETEFTDEAALVRSVNPAFTDVFGFDQRAVLDSDLDEFVLPPNEDARQEAQQLDAQGADGETVQAELRRRTADGFRDFLFRGIPYRRDDGRVWSFGIYTDITEQKERQRRLEVLNRVLRHNLRNDLTVVLGLADELHERTDDETHRDLIERLRRKAEQIASLSDRAREIERSVRREDAERSPVDITERIPSLVAQYEQRYDAPIETSLPAASVEGADGRFGRVVGELLENSLEHAGDEPTVSVIVESSPETVSVTVADDGPGIPQHELDVLTGSEPITQLSHGSGLGLWLVIWVTESYGGTVTFENTPDGATVTLSLPKTND